MDQNYLTKTVKPLKSLCLIFLQKKNIYLEMESHQTHAVKCNNSCWQSNSGCEKLLFKEIFHPSMKFLSSFTQWIIFLASPEEPAFLSGTPILDLEILHGDTFNPGHNFLSLY